MKPSWSFMWYMLGVFGTAGFLGGWVIGGRFIFLHGSLSKDAMDITNLALSTLAFVIGSWQSALKKAKREAIADFKENAQKVLTPATKHFSNLRKSVNSLGQWKKKLLSLIEQTNFHQEELQTLESIQDNADFSQIAEFGHCLNAISTVIGHLYDIQEDDSNNTHISRGQLSQEIGVVIRELIRLNAVVKR